jgi:hypothetical protein
MDQVYVTSFPGQESKWQVSTDGGTNPKWSREGRELYYVSPEGMAMVVAIRNTTPLVELSSPSRLFRMPADSYDVFGDGRFLMPIPREPRPSAPLSLVINWASDIQR